MVPAATVGVASAGGAGGANKAPIARRFGWRLGFGRQAPETPQRPPVLLAGGELGLVPQVAGVTAPGTASWPHDHTDRVFMLIGTQRLDATSLATKPHALLAVADELGGSFGDREASKRAIQAVADYVSSRLAVDAPADASALTSLLAEALVQANKDLYQRNIHERAGAGTTMTAALLMGNVAHIVNVGDSRTYLFSALRGLRKITTDHSIVAALVATELLPPEALYTHPRRGQIYRCLGRQRDMQVDSYQVTLEPEDRLVLCSDGLWGAVRDPHIESILRAVPDPSQAAEQLLAAAKRHGVQDSASVIVARTLQDYVTREPSPAQSVPPAGEQSPDTSDAQDMVSPGHVPDRK
jgi:serine/threonine protein phosphatase PrpC